MIQYAAVDRFGNVLGVERTAAAATEVVHELAPGTTIAVQEIDASDLVGNATDPEQMPAIALANSRLSVVSERAASMSIDDAYRKILPFFDGLKKRGLRTGRYDTYQGMAKAFIGQNYKTKKKVPGQPLYKVMGVTLVPAAHPRLAAIGLGPYQHLRDSATTEGMQMIQRWKRELPIAPTDKKFTLCTGSNAACRDSCLVFAGQNASELYNTYRKVAQTMALLNEPEAFMRMLVESIDRWERSREVAAGGVLPFMRLNVLSDVPWELVAPWLFERFSKLQFYDYTKVPGRKVPKNYDLTFSISGSNFDWAQAEINERRRRIAVVFLGHKKRGDSWRPVKLKGPKLLEGVPLPHTFWGLPVVDGDISDVRPLDPAPSCVGLRWKTPSSKRSGVEIDLAGHSFVVPVYVISADQLSGYRKRAGSSSQSWEGVEPNGSDEQWLISPVVPNQQPITPAELEE